MMRVETNVPAMGGTFSITAYGADSTPAIRHGSGC